LREGLKRCEDVIKELEINSTTTQTQIKQFFHKIRIKLDEKEQELLNQLEEIEKHKNKELGLQKDELKFGIESIIGSCKMIEDSLALSSQNDNVKLLSMKKLYYSRLNYLSNYSWDLEPHCCSLVEVLVNEKEEQSIYSNISNIGIIDSNEIPDKKSLISRFGKQRISENKEFLFEIQVKSKLKQRNYNEINGSSGTFESEGNRKSQFQSPWGITIDSNERIFICDTLNHRIQIFDSEGKFLSTFGSEGNGNGQFGGPIGISINSKDNILICDNANNRVQKFNSEQKFITTFGSKGNGIGQFNNPRGICVDKNDNIYVCDTGNNRIQIFDSEGKFISVIGSKGNENENENSQFVMPWVLLLTQRETFLLVILVIT